MNTTVRDLATLCLLSDSASEVGGTLRKHPFQVIKAVGKTLGVKVDGTKDQLVETIASFAGMRGITNEIEDRAKFEAFAKKELLDLRPKTVSGKSGYHHYATHVAWLAWQAKAVR